MFYKKLLITLSLLVLIIGLVSCSDPVDIDNRDGEEPEGQDFPVIVNNITIPSRPQNVAVLSPSIADIIIALDYEASLALASEDCVQNELVDLKKVSVDDYQAFTTAEIDLIITDSIDLVHKDTFTQMSIPVVIIEDAVDRTDFDRMYSQVGSILMGANTGLNEGVDEARSIYSVLDDIERLIPETETIVTGAFLLDTTSAAITGDTVGDDVMTAAGITNIFKGSLDRSFTMEELNIADPQYLFCLEGMKSEIMSSTKFANLSAVRSGNVFELPESNILWYGRSLIIGASTMAGIVYPELLESQDLDPDAPEGMELEEESSIAPSPSPTPTPTTTESSTEATEDEDTTTQSSADTVVEELPEHEDSGEYRWLRFEDQGEEVLAMQNRLKELGYLTVEFNGYYGENTIAAISLFQENTGLDVTGEAEPNTLAYLFDENAVAYVSG